MILGITPARGGSKGILRKNLRPVGGRPLITWTLEAAKASHLMDRYIVSTEDRDIAALTAKSGVEILERPPELATDEASTVSVLQHALSAIDADIVVLLQATSPIRSRDLIDRCIRTFQQTEADALATGFISTHTGYGPAASRRQDNKASVFCDDGNVYVVKADLVRAGLLFGGRVEKLVVSREENVDVDDEFDLWLAEQILQRKESSWDPPSGGFVKVRLKPDPT